MRQKHLDLIVSVVIAVLNILWVLLPMFRQIPGAGIILALPIVFLLPGYMLTELLFHRRTLEPIHRFLFGLGLSMAIDILTGFLLNIFPFGLSSLSWALWLGGMTILLALLIAFLRRNTIVPFIRLGKMGSFIAPARFHVKLYQPILFGLAVVMIILAVRYAANGVTQEPHPGFTQFWILPAQQRNASCSFQLGVRSFESEPMTYRVQVEMNGIPTQLWSSVVLVPQEEWDQPVAIKAAGTTNTYVDARLYRVDQSGNVYREVHVTFHSVGKSKDGQIPHCII